MELELKRYEFANWVRMCLIHLVHRSEQVCSDCPTEIFGIHDIAGGVSEQND